MLALLSLLFGFSLSFTVLLSQPNSITLHHYLVEYTVDDREAWKARAPRVDPVRADLAYPGQPKRRLPLPGGPATSGTATFYTPTRSDGTPLQPIQLGQTKDGTLLLLDFKHGLYSYKLGDNSSVHEIVSAAQLPGESAWDFTTDDTGSVYVANMNPTEVSPFARKPVIVKFSLATGAYEATIVNATVDPTWTAITGVTYVGKGVLAVSLETGIFVLVDSTTGKVQATLSPPLRDVRYVTKLTAAPDGKRFCFASGGISPAHPDQLHCLASLSIGAPLTSFPLEAVAGVPSNGTTPSGLSFVSNDEVAIVVTDAELGHTHHIQLLSTSKGFLAGYGSTSCDDVLCMPFNGIVSM
jgi:hypothetical protein